MRKSKPDLVYNRLVLADRAVNIIAMLLLCLLSIFALYSIWYSEAIKGDSFLSDDLARYRPLKDEPTMKELRKLNPDVIGWITMEDTGIDYPIVQGKNDLEYLNRTVTGEFSLAGSLFLSSDNKRDLSDPYNIIYGHHIEGGGMLSDVIKYKRKRYFDKHRYGILWHAADHVRADRIKVFAAVRTVGSDLSIYRDLRMFTSADIPGLLSAIEQKAVRWDPSVIGGNERIIALSTCENGRSFERMILYGTLQPMSDEEIKNALLENETRTVNKRPDLIQWLYKWGVLILLLLLIQAILIWRLYKHLKNEDRA